MRYIKDNFAILSAERPKENNKLRTSILSHILEDLNFPFARCEGMYKGDKETSFLVVVKNKTELEIIAQIAFNQFDQESILYRDRTKGISLIFEKEVQPLKGTFTKVNTIDGLDAYTKINNNYYIIK